MALVRHVYRGTLSQYCGLFYDLSLHVVSSHFSNVLICVRPGVEKQWFLYLLSIRVIAM